MQLPTIGRIVHYQSYGTPRGEFSSVPRAAIITDAPHREPGEVLREGDVVDLCVLNPTGMFFNRGVPYSEKPKPGHWSWPPRV